MIRRNGIDACTALLQLLCLLFASISHLHACPTQCRCTGIVPGGGGERVVCPPGQNSLPAGLDPNTVALVLSGTPLPQGGNNIPALRHSDLTSLPALEELTLPFAQLVDLQEDALSALKKLKRLNLHDNQVKLLTPRTFSGLNELDFLDLTNNDGCVIQGDVFGSLTSMKTLYLGGMGLREVKSQWFKSLTALESLDLHDNQIVTLDSDFLQGLVKVKMLDLTGNQLQALPPSLQPTLTSLPSLYLEGNPWHCNCELRWFKQFHVPRHSSDAVVCLTPQPLAYREVSKVPDGELLCLPPKILNCPGPYDVNAGNDVILECDIEGDPFPEVTWTAPDGKATDTKPPGPFTAARRTVNTSLVTGADFALHSGQWSVSATSSQGTVTGQVTVNVFTTTTTTTTTTTIPSTLKARVSASKTTDQPVVADDANSMTNRSIWFYLALAAFGLTALALVSLILVVALKLRRDQRQIGQDRRNSGLSLGSTTETDLTVFTKPSQGQGKTKASQNNPQFASEPSWRDDPPPNQRSFSFVDSQHSISTC